MPTPLLCGIGVEVTQEISNLLSWVRFPHTAPNEGKTFPGRLYGLTQLWKFNFFHLCSIGVMDSTQHYGCWNEGSNPSWGAIKTKGV